MATSTTSVALSPLLVKLNVTGLQKRDQPLYDFLSHLLFTTGQVASAVGVASSSGGGGGSTTNITNILQQFNLGDSGSGEDGSPGPPGPQGNPGTSGSTGASGAIGPATYLTDISAPDEVFPIPGPIGPIGNTGLTGNDGPAIFITAQDGMDGEPSSIPGPQGPQGNQGAAGTTGNDGPGIFLVNDIYPDDVLPIPGGQGPTGNPGSTGPSGSPGQVQAVFVEDWSQPDIPVILGIPSQASDNAIIQVDYVEYTTGVTISATTEATANTVVTGNAVTYDGVTPVIIEFFSPFVTTSTSVGSAILFWLYQDGSSIGNLAQVQNPGTAAMRSPVLTRRRMIPTNGSHTYSIRADRATANGTVSAGPGGVGQQMPGYIRITTI